MQGHSTLLRNSGDFELTEFEIARFDCMSKAMWNLHLKFWAHQKCIGAGIIDIWISFDLWSWMAEEQNLHREQ